MRKNTIPKDYDFTPINVKRPTAKKIRMLAVKEGITISNLLELMIQNYE